MPSFGSAYRQMREALQAGIEAKLGRALEPSERRVLQNVGSLMMLESWERSVAHESDPGRIAEELRDSAPWEKRFHDALPKFFASLEQRLQRPLRPEEKSALEGSQTLESAVLADELLSQTPPAEVEAVFARILHSPL